jgi:cytochrome c oxidase cbb3-type subunit III
MRAFNDMWQRSLLIVCGVTCALLCMAGCGAPGKPGPPEVAPEEQTNFHALFRDNCQGCHGVDGRGGPARILNDPLYLAVLPRQELYNVIENGRPGTAMPAWALKNAGPFSEKQVNSLVDGIENNWAKPEQFRGVKLPSYYGPQNGGDAAAGEKLFLRDCSLCHGPHAAIGSVTDAAFLSLITNQCLRTSIIVGRPDFRPAMLDYRQLNLGRELSDDDISNLVAYLSAKRPPEITAMLERAQTPAAGQQTGATGGHENENGTGQTGPITKETRGVGRDRAVLRNRKMGTTGAEAAREGSSER